MRRLRTYLGGRLAVWLLLFCGFVAADVAVAVLGSRVASESLLQARVTRLACQAALATLTLTRPWQPSPSPHPNPCPPPAGHGHPARPLRRGRASRRAALPRGGRRRRGDRGVDVGQAASISQRGRLFPLFWKQRVQRRLCPWVVTITVMGRGRRRAPQRAIGMAAGRLARSRLPEPNSSSA